jgi:adenylate cyclase
MDPNDPREAEIRRDMQNFFAPRESNSPPIDESEYAWQSPGSWGFMSKDTYAPARPRNVSVEKPADLGQLWALRVFKPVEVTDVSKVAASSGYTYVTISCDLDCSAAELCQMLMRKFTSHRDLSCFRLYVVHRGTERLLSHEDQPVRILRRHLVAIGYTEGDALSKIAREDHSYCCRFIFREYPPAPPRSEDFTTADGNNSNRPRARITPRSAYLADANLPVIPTVMFQLAATMEFIDLSRNTLLVLPDDLFEMLGLLRLLRLTENLLTEVPSAILKCPSITHLDLSSNSLEGDALAVLAEMPRLTHLNVSCNRISALPDALSKLLTLRSLDISSNYLTEFSPCIWGMTDLRELNASFNKITEIPAALVEHLPSLRSLILVGNAIETLNSRMFELKHLHQLDMRGNLLTSMKGVAHVSSLFEVSLDYNQLTSLAGPVWPHVTVLSCINNALTGVSLNDYLYSLRRLNLSSSKIVGLPDDLFAYMTGLDTLILAQNELTRLPHSVNMLAQLERLIVHSNSLTEVALDFGYLHKLTLLELHTNNIRSITSEIWQAPNLKVLNISSNFLTSLPPAPVSMETLPLSKTLHELLVADNRLGDGVGDVLVLLTELRVLNLSYNRIFGLGDALRDMTHLVELYLSGNGLTAFPEDIDHCTALRMLFINGNKLSNLPAELGKNSQLAVFDVQSNVLKYNISNWPYDWNWNFNANLQYLNLAHNRRLEIKAPFAQTENHKGHSGRERNLADFKMMPKLRLLDVSGVQVSPACLPAGATTMQIRLGTQPEQQPQISNLKVAIAEYCGREVIFDAAELVIQSFMGQEKDHLVGLFDGRTHDFVASFLVDTLEDNLKLELRRMRQGEEFSMALRRAFLATNRDLSTQPVDTQNYATACLLYILESQLLIANVGDTMAILSREGTAHVLATKHHPWMRGEQARILSQGGFISLQGLVQGELPVTRAFGRHYLLPFVNASPSVNELLLGPTDEFILMATASFWRVMSYQLAVDVARQERSDPDVAVQKLRDMAVARGVTDSMRIVYVCLRGITAQGSAAGAEVVEKRRTAFRRGEIDDQVLSRLDDEIPPPKPPCAFVFTDIKDSTKLWSLLPNAMRVAIKQHNTMMRRLMRIHGGYEVKTEGDAFVVAFQSTLASLKFCIAVQTHFLEAEWPREILESPVASPVYSPEGRLLRRGLSIRMGIHYGMADDEEDKVARRMDYHGIHMIIAARVSALADGGQINITETIRRMFNEAPESERPDCTIIDLGMTPLKGLTNPEHLYVVYPRSLAGRHRLQSDSIKSGEQPSPLAKLSTLAIVEETPVDEEASPETSP